MSYTSDSSLIIKLQCLGCGDRFPSELVTISQIDLRADICEVCRLKARLIPDYLPKYLTIMGTQG